MEKKLSDQNQYSRNPFIEDLSLKTYHKAVLPQESKNTGEVPEFVDYQQVDKEKFVKVFTHQLKLFYKLTKRESDVLVYILQRMRPNNDIIHLKTSEIRKELSIGSNATIASSINKLINEGIIARTVVPGGYYINPSVAFNGDRVKFTRVYEVSRQDDTKLLKKQKQGLKSPENKNRSKVIIPADELD